MVANKNNPNPSEEKMYQADSYRLSSSVPGLKYNLPGTNSRPSIGDSARQKDIPTSDKSLDHLIQTPATNEFYQHATETHPTPQRKSYPAGSGIEYDLSQPVWFYMIMKKLAAEKEKKK